MCPTSPYLTARFFLTVHTAEAGLLGVEAEAGHPARGSLAGSGAGPGLEGRGLFLGAPPRTYSRGGSCSTSKHMAVLRAGAHDHQGALWGRPPQRVLAQAPLGGRWRWEGGGGPTSFRSHAECCKGAAQTWGSCLAPRARRCCPNPQPKMGGACAAQLWAGRYLWVQHQ